MKKYIVWYEDDFFDEIYNQSRNIVMANSSEEAAQSYVSNDMDGGFCTVRVVALDKIINIIDKMKMEGVFTKKMEDGVFSKGHKFSISVSTIFNIVRIEKT